MWFVALVSFAYGLIHLSQTVDHPKFVDPLQAGWASGNVFLSVFLIVVGLVCGAIALWQDHDERERKNPRVVFDTNIPPHSHEDEDDGDDNKEWDEFILLTRLITFQIPDGGEFEVEFRKASDQAIAACIKEFGEDSLYDYPIVSIKISLHPTMRLWAFLEVEYYTHPGEWMEEA